MPSEVRSASEAPAMQLDAEPRQRFEQFWDR